VPFREEPVELPNNQPPRWAYFVALAEHDAGQDPFPGRAGGLVLHAGGGPLAPPSFARKKDAKQYAARCAVEWLRAQGHMPNDGTEAVKFATPAAKVAAKTASGGGTTNTSATKQPKAADKPIMVAAEEKKEEKGEKYAVPPAATLITSLADDLSKSSASMSVLASTSSSVSRSETPAGTKRKNRKSPSQQDQQQQQQQQQQPVNPFDEDAPSSAARVAELCNVLGMSPPTYKITPATRAGSGRTGSDDDDDDQTHSRNGNDNGDNLWSGYAEFSGLCHARFANGIGHVTGVYGGRAFARERVAEAVVRELERVKRARLDDFEAVMQKAAAIKAEQAVAAAAAAATAATGALAQEGGGQEKDTQEGSEELGTGNDGSAKTAVAEKPAGAA
jgi:hypothetical protein